MSADQLKAFLDCLKGDRELQGRLANAVDADAIIALANEAGFLITTADLEREVNALSDDDIEGIYGAGSPPDSCCCPSSITVGPVV